MIRRPPRAVIFDLDGTLVDTAGDFIPAMADLCRGYGVPVPTGPAITRQVSNGAAALVALALGLRAGDEGYGTARAALLAHYASHLGRHAALYPGMAALLRSLGERNIGWAIATNKPEAYALPLMAALAPIPEPAAIVCPEHVERSKPDPECLMLCCERLGCRPGEAIYVGDHPRDIEAGRRAGMTTVAAAWGYIEEGDAAARWEADLVVADSRELQAALGFAAPTLGDTGS